LENTFSFAPSFFFYYRFSFFTKKKKCMDKMIIHGNIGSILKYLGVLMIIPLALLVITTSFGVHNHWLHSTDF